MRRLTIMTLALTLTLFTGCKQTAEDRYQRYLEEVEKDPVAPPTDDGPDPFANDNEGVYTIPEIPQERKVDMNSNTYELDKYMRGKE